MGADHEIEAIFRRADHRGAEGSRGRREKAKYAGMTVSEARSLRELEAENSKLKKLLAEAELDKAALKDLLHRKW
jgi:hypothetical protein